MNKEKIVILDFTSSNVTIANLPASLHNAQIEDIEGYIEDVLNIDVSNCQFIYGNLSIEDMTK